MIKESSEPAISDKINIPPKSQKLIIYIILTIVTFAVFWQVNQFEFVNLDDNIYVTENIYVKSGFTLDGFRWAFCTKWYGLWHPLLWFSLMLDYQLIGLNAGGYHITNLVLHILSTLLLFWLFNRMTGTIWKSAFVAALFALHPLHVESVAWIAERKDVLSAFFWMLTLCLYVYYTEKPVIKRYLLVLFSFILALMSKPMVVTLPLIMILLDYWPLSRLHIGIQSQKNNVILWQLKEKLPFFILSTALVMFILYTPDIPALKQIPFSSRLANAPVSFMTYLEKTFWPHDLAIFYPFPDHIPLWQVSGATLLIIFISVFVIVMAKRLPYLFVGWLWYAITIFPVLKIVQVGNDAMADRYHYLPSIGIAVMLVWGMPFLFTNENTRKKILFPAALVFLITLALLTWKQCGYWKNGAALFSHALQVTKNNYLAHNNFAHYLLKEGKNEGALFHFNESIRTMPDYVVYKGYFIYNNRGLSYTKLGQYHRAIFDFNEAIHRKPDYADAYNNRGNVYAKLDRPQQAIADFSEAIRLKPDYTSAYINRGNIFDNTGQYQLAINDYTKAIDMKPDSPESYNNRGSAYFKLGQYQRAFLDFNTAIFLKPDYAAYNNRGGVYAKLGRYQLAIEDFNQAINLKQDYVDAYNNRATIYLNQGNKDLGCHDAKKACSLGNCKLLVWSKINGYCR